ncbi:cytochrome P450 [Streptomyces sp. SLBN-31]|uniref:cytochrome P450 n=1 Tax=Streptomyces sp. SLBN-31 TaxID=2768444 RepID=UPI0011543471|nr:cytochrome P450 [Streptomyces sp. SLBN-31]TQJ86901.1 pentalenene oxygenase [Streptomyces sp. SLBN-31]
MAQADYSFVVAPGALPLLGHTLRFLRDPLRFLRSLPDFGDIVTIRLGPVSPVVVCAPELVRRVLVDDRTFDKGGFLFDRSREFLGNGLGTCLHKDHRRQRRMIQPAFHRARLPGYAREMNAQAHAVTDAWQDGRTIDVLAETTAISLRTTAATIFSAAPAALRESLAADLVTLEEGVFRRMLLPPHVDAVPTPGKRRYDRAHARSQQTIDRIIADYRADGVDHGDLMSMLLAAQDDLAGPGTEGARLSDEEVRDQVMSFLFASTDTIGKALAWALHLLGGHPHLAERLHAEADAVLAGGVAGFEDLPRLEVTRNIITETMRLYPPGWLLTRTTTVDAELGGRHIPAGTDVAFSPYQIHHRGDLFTEPERFDPDRWGPDRAGAIPREAYLPFGGGARKCIGDAYALTEATLALATIAARWRLEPTPGRRVRAAPYALALGPKGLFMRTVARDVAGHEGRRRSAVPGEGSLRPKDTSASRP